MPFAESLLQSEDGASRATGFYKEAARLGLPQFPTATLFLFLLYHHPCLQHTHSHALTYTYARTHSYTHPRTHMYMYGHMHSHTCTCIHSHTSTHTHITYAHTHLHIHSQTYAHTNTFTQTHMHSQTCVCVRVRVHTRTHTLQGTEHPAAQPPFQQTPYPMSHLPLLCSLGILGLSGPIKRFITDHTH